jgi:hypothetical protein
MDIVKTESWNGSNSQLRKTTMLERYQGKRYSVYNRRTGQPIYIYGTAPQCAAAMGVTLGSFFSLMSKSRRRPSVKYEFFTDVNTEEDNE